MDRRFHRERDGGYRPRPTVLALGYPVLSRLTLAQIAQPHLEALSARVSESVSLAVLQSDTEITYRARAATAERLTTVDLHIGTCLPVYMTSIGRCCCVTTGAPSRTASPGYCRT